MDQRRDWRLTDALIYEHGRGDPFAAAVRGTRMPMVVTDPRLPDNPIVYCNAAFQKLCGYDRDEIVGRNCRFLQGPDTDQAAIGRVREAIATGKDVEAELLNYRKNGSTFWNALYLSPVRDHTGEVNYFFASQLDITERKQVEQQAIAARQLIEQEVAARTADLESALETKTLLLHELDHRVKNNLTMIGSLLRLQARAVEDDATSHLVEDMLRRVDALGTVHRRLYQSVDVTLFDIAAFMAELAAELVSSIGSDRITLTTELTSVEIAPGHASAIGLVLNEILVGSIEHAFPEGRTGTLHLRTAVDGDVATIDIDTDGPGLPASAVKGFGHTLIQRLSRQIGFETKWIPGPNGSRVTMSFPLGRLR